MFKEIKESMSKKIKERIKVISHQIGNIKKELELYKNEPNRNSGLEKYNNKVLKIH